MGHGGVGKTSFINRYIHNNFAETVSVRAQKVLWPVY